MLTQTLTYLDSFARFRQKENVEAVERLLSARKELTKYERAQLGAFPPKKPPPQHSGEILDALLTPAAMCPTGSLCCSEADEAKTLIPSLTDKISNDDLTELLEEIAKLQSA